MKYDKTKNLSLAAKARLEALERVAQKFIDTRENAWEIARAQVQRDIALAKSERDAIVRDLFVMMKDPTQNHGLSAAAIKRAMKNSNHSEYQGIVRGFDYSQHVTTAPWYLEEPYLSTPWNFTKPQYANGFWLYDLTSFYQWAGDPIQMWFGHDTSPGSVEGYSTMSKHLNWGEFGPDPFATVLEQGLPGVPEDKRREILEQFTLAIKKAAGK